VCINEISWPSSTDSLISCRSCSKVQCTGAYTLTDSSNQNLTSSWLQNSTRTLLRSNWQPAKFGTISSGIVKQHDTALMQKAGYWIEKNMDEMVPQGSWYKNSKMGITLAPHSVICLNCVLYTSMVRIEYQVREMQKVRASKSFPRSASKLWVITPTFSPSTPPPPRLIFDHNWLAFFAKQYVCCMYVHGLLVQWSRVSMALSPVRGFM